MKSYFFPGQPSSLSFAYYDLDLTQKEISRVLEAWNILAAQVTDRPRGQSVVNLRTDRIVPIAVFAVASIPSCLLTIAAA